MEEFRHYFESPTFQKIAAVIVGAFIIFAIVGIVRKLIPKYVAGTNTRYRVRKFVNYIGYFIFLMLVMMVFSSQLSGLNVFLGVAGAGIAFALQEVIASIAGFIVVNFSNFYKVGDRVMLGGIKGDVVDIGILRTSMLQLGDWVDGDLYNGKFVRVANSFIFKEPVYNYSGDFPFLWDEITVPIRIDGDIDYARRKFLEILDEIQGEYARDAIKYWIKMTETLMIEHEQVAPMVTMVFDENWITFTLRYVVDYKKRRSTKDLIFSQILIAIRNSKGKISIASDAQEITFFKGADN